MVGRLGVALVQMPVLLSTEHRASAVCIHPPGSHLGVELVACEGHTSADVQNRNGCIACSVIKRIKSARRYCMFEHGSFRPSRQNHAHKCDTLSTLHRLLLMFAIPPMRFGDYAHRTEGIPELDINEHVD